jgi:hypothetical protein
VSEAQRRPLRVALLYHRHGSDGVAESLVSELAAALREAGHEPCVISSRPGWLRRSLEWPLARRGFDGPLTHLPLAVRELDRGGCDVAHAFSHLDALAARLWRGGPAIFTCAEPLGRAELANRRLRLRLLGGAFEGTDALVAPTEEARAALWRWLAVEARVLEAGDAAAHERLYRELLDRRL